MIKIILVSIAASTLSFSQAFALIGSCTKAMTNVEGELLIKDLTQFSAEPPASNGMTKEKFISIIDHVTDIFQPRFAKEGAKLTVNKRWDDKNEDISASQWPNGNWRVTITGGFARHPLISEDGFIFALCHEIGHHIGGAPRGNNNTSWSSNEGQADYFASLKCFRKIMETEDNISIVSKMQIDAEVTTQCRNVYKTPQDVALCQRTAMAGYSVANLIASRSETPIIKFSPPDRTRSSKTMEEAAFAQCRLDTYFQGALCDKPVTEEVSKDDPAVGTCTAKNGFSIGLRPLCWYSPSN
jgi:hypothetical protein